jgi:hypothetical protein
LDPETLADEDSPRRPTETAGIAADQAIRPTTAGTAPAAHPRVRSSNVTAAHAVRVASSPGSINPKQVVY